MLFLEPSRLYRAEKEDVVEAPVERPLRLARIVREGNDLTIVAWGAMIPAALKAAEAAAGVSAEIIDLRTLSPFDEETVLASAAKTGRVLLVHEAPRQCGLGAELAAVIAEKALLSLKAPILRVTGPDITIPLPRTEDLYYVEAGRIGRGIRRLMEF